MNNKNQTPPENQQPAPVQYYYPDDEISLIDLWNTLMRRKKIVIAVFVLVIVAAIIYLLIAEPVYESRVMFQVGQVGQLEQREQTGYIENPVAFKQRVEAEYSEIAKTEIPKGGADNVVVFTLQKSTKDEARERLEDISEKILWEHREKIEDAIRPLKERRNSFQEQLRSYRNQQHELNLKAESLLNSDPAQAVAIMVEKGNTMRMLPELEERLARAEQALSKPHTRQSQILGKIVSPEKPIKPKPGLVMALSIILGLMLGIFAAFFAEFIAKARTSTTGKEM